MSTQSASAPIDGTLGTIDLNAVRAALDARTGGGATTDPTAPAEGPGRQGPRTSPPSPSASCVTDSAGNRGEDRKVLFAYRDTSLHSGWPRQHAAPAARPPSACTTSTATTRSTSLQADSSGELSVLEGRRHAAGRASTAASPCGPSLRERAPRARPSYAQVAAPREVAAHARDRRHRRRPRAGDRGLGGRARVRLERRRQRSSPGFPVRLDPALSTPALRTRDNHIKRGFIASPDARRPRRRPGARDRGARARPARLRLERPGPAARRASPEARDPTVPGGARSSTTAAVGNIAGDARPEIVVPTAEFDPNPTAPGTPTGPLDLAGALRGGLTNVLANALGGSGRMYALGANGAVLPGLADQAERRGARRAAARRPRRGPRAGERGRRPAARGDRQRGDRATWRPTTATARS